MRSQKITFPGSQGELAARLDLPVGKPRGYALFAHCFTCSKDIFAASRIAREMTAMGLAVLRFDFTGLGMSEGEFASTNFSSNVDDLLTAAAHMRETLAAPKILIGHSLGGAAVLAAAGDIPEVQAVATIAAPFDPAHVSHHFADKVAEIEQAGEAEVTLAGRPFRVRRQFLDDIRSQDQASRVANLKKPLAIFHSPIDNLVGIENASEIFRHAKHPKSFISLDKADHLLTRAEDAAYVARTLVAWAQAYVDGLDTPALAGPLQPSLDHVVVSEAAPGRLTQVVNAAGHRLLADEPEAMGGDNAGPSPYDLVLAGLGACTTLTVRMYAERKGWPLTRASVRLHHEKIHAQDCADCETRSGKVDLIRRQVALEGELSDDQRAKLMEIADKCPVHRTLHSEVKVETEEAR
ncbi:putative redox protein [Rhodothalassium salexigens DSM 2132]|uniref:Putative redox protein n=1 Tax=Rhodothalassium salexigens DSM 2132 TaxID=1188247 RepID=A0A4R2PTH8_RHOSA|nr:alpha/beta fold hydrolase [Rhodothalassium salexigens]MBB4210154.1 putative redox protein [Rhodothalassium salexigens DSM 2132]MBK1639319.1 osmotically inducible protein C [Rhodothalassium salexigens DSM 2132]TCP38318.1 putative redox protein [Rhodothalassium salexigens DSM 2132]